MANTSQVFNNVLNGRFANGSFSNASEYENFNGYFSEAGATQFNVGDSVVYSYDSSGGSNYSSSVTGNYQGYYISDGGIQYPVVKISGNFYLFGQPSGQQTFPVTSQPFTQDTYTAPCYRTGTLIRVVRDDAEAEVAVESLSIGDTVVTASGAHRPIRWIGTRSYAPRFLRNNPALLPIRFRAGSLNDGVPARDLLVSPKHAMLLDGVLIPAEHLVNGRTITKEEHADLAGDLTYWHVELDSHDVLIAEGAASESFVDDQSRSIFHNAHTFRALYPHQEQADAVYCAPRVESGYTLQRVRRRLAERAGLPLPTLRDLGALRGYIDGCVSDGRGGVNVRGWAQSMAYPDAPVCLEVVVDGAVVALASAELFRADLAAAEIGDGHHSFYIALSEVRLGAVVTVRRAADGAVLGWAGAVAPEVIAA